MKGFKHTGKGPKYGAFSFPSKAGFSQSGTNKQNVKGYTRSAPKKKFAAGGMVTAPMATGDSSVIKRTKPVTGFDSEHGGKSPLRPGFNKGGKACYAFGGRAMRDAVGRAAPARTGVAPPQGGIPAPAAPAQRPVMSNHGYGNFGRRPMFR